jgi:hypothetical protein
MPLGGEGLGQLQLRFDSVATGDLTVEADGQCLWRHKIKARPEQRFLLNLTDLNGASGANVITIGIRES